MAKKDYAVGAVTRRAAEVNAAAYERRSADGKVVVAKMPAIRYFIPAYNDDVVIRDRQEKFLGMKTPWFNETPPAGEVEEDFYYYPPSALLIDDIINVAALPGVFTVRRDGDNWDSQVNYDERAVVAYENAKYISKIRDNLGNAPDPEDESYWAGYTNDTLFCDIDPGKVTIVKGSGETPTSIKVILEKLSSGYNYSYLDSDGKIMTGPPEANVFYIADAEHNILAVLHAYGFTFGVGDKWEIIQHLVYQRAMPIEGVYEEDVPFDLQMARETLIPDVVVGSEADWRAKKASHDIENFLKDFADSTAPNMALNGLRILFLETARAVNQDLVAISADNIRFDMKNPAAILDFNGAAVALGGNGLRGCLNLSNVGQLTLGGDDLDLTLNISNAADGCLEVSGDNVYLKITARDNNGELRDNALNFSGKGICVMNGWSLCRSNTVGIDISGDIRHAGDLEITGNLKIAGGLIVYGYLKHFENWQAPVLQNNWTEYAQEYNPPGYFKDEMGIVRLRGMIKNGSGVIFKLPPGYRPRYREVMTACADAHYNNLSKVDIMPDGDVVSKTSVNNWLSLDGVTFRSSDMVSRIIQEDWQAPTLLNNWEEYGGDYNPSGYFKDSEGMVRLRGLIKGGSGDMFNLPAGYRPPQYQELMIVSGDHKRARVDIASDGDVFVVEGSASDWVSLDDVTFSSDDSQNWQSATLENSWAIYHHSSWGPPEYFKDSMGIVRLRGLIAKGVLGTVIFTLPEGYRPQYKERLIAGIPSSMATIDIDVDGKVVYLGNNNGWVSLNGITFRAFDVFTG